MSNITIKDIVNAKPYWLEQKPYTVNITSISANQSYPLFNLIGINKQNSVSQLVELSRLAISNVYGIRIDINYDKKSWRGYSQSFPNNLEMTDMEFGAVYNMSVVLTNTTSNPINNIQVNYLMTIWTMSTTYKVLQNYPITQQEQNSAKRLGISTSTVDQQGTYPIPLSAIIERTYSNRKIGNDMTLSNVFTCTTTQSTIYHEVVTNENEMLILRSIGTAANAKYGIIITVDRDNDQSELILNGENMMIKGLNMFMPATNHFNVYIQSSVNVPGLVPVFINMWRISMSNILRTRMGNLSLNDLQTLFATGAITPQQITAANQAAQKFYDDVVIGVR
jgi:hypothetical protein